MNNLPSKRKSAEEIQNLRKQHIEQQMFLEKMKGTPAKAHPALIILGYIFAFGGGVVGLIMACFIIAKPGSKHHGAFIAIISVFFLLIWKILSN